MSDNGNGLPQPADQDPAIGTVTIVARKSGMVEVGTNGVASNPLFAYGMLEIGKDIVRDRGKKEERRVEPVALFR